MSSHLLRTRKGMLRSALFLVAFTECGLAAAAAAPHHSVFQLLVDPTRVKFPGELMFTAQCLISGERVDLGRSLLEVRNVNGRVVFKGTSPFSFQAQGIVSSGTFRADRYVSFPALPDGKYAAVWKIDGHVSNIARFVVGSEPNELLLEPLSNGLFGECLVLHVFNPGSTNLDLPSSEGEAELKVDELIFKGSPPPWAGYSYLQPRTGWSWVFDPKMSFRANVHGRHVYSVRFVGKWSNKVETECKD